MSHESFDATLGSTRWERVQQFYRDVDLLLLLTEHDAARFELEGFNNVGVMHNSLSFYPERSPATYSATSSSPPAGSPRRRATTG